MRCGPRGRVRKKERRGASALQERRRNAFAPRCFCPRRPGTFPRKPLGSSCIFLGCLGGHQRRARRPLCRLRSSAARRSSATSCVRHSAATTPSPPADTEHHFVQHRPALLRSQLSLTSWYMSNAIVSQSPSLQRDVTRASSRIGAKGSELRVELPSIGINKTHHCWNEVFQKYNSEFACGSESSAAMPTMWPGPSGPGVRSLSQMPPKLTRILLKNVHC